MSRADTGRPQRRTTAEFAPRPPRWRYLAGGSLVAIVLAIGLVLGFGDFLDRPAGGTATPVRLSMAGFEPELIHAVAGEPLSLELWTTDAALHLEGGVHSLVSDELGISEELPAESRKTVTLQMPDAAGTYDIYCDSCCGGRENPTMHGRIHVAET